MLEYGRERRRGKERSLRGVIFTRKKDQDSSSLSAESAALSSVWEYSELTSGALSCRVGIAAIPITCSQRMRLLLSRIRGSSAPESRALLSQSKCSRSPLVWHWYCLYRECCNSPNVFSVLIYKRSRRHSKWKPWQRDRASIVCARGALSSASRRHRAPAKAAPSERVSSRLARETLDGATYAPLVRICM